MHILTIGEEPYLHNILDTYSGKGETSGQLHEEVKGLSMWLMDEIKCLVRIDALLFGELDDA